jgi:type III secretion protein L
MRKLFVLSEDKEISLSTTQKILPAKEFSTLLEAEEVLSRAQEEALKYRKKVVEECELQKEQSAKEGFEEGLLQFNKQIAYLEKEIVRQREEIQKSIVSLATAAVKKIIGKELKTHPEVIVDLVSTALKPVKQHRRVTIYVNSDDLAIVEKHRPQIKDLFEHLENLSIQAREDITKGDCIIETEAGIINAQLDNQLLALEQAFRQIVETKKV